jgi:hypothetical protein
MVAVFFVVGEEVHERRRRLELCTQAGTPLAAGIGLLGYKAY